jgi:hypothetical protein
MNNDEKDAVAAWLTKHGYPFELHVGEVLRSGGWSVEHSKVYSDVTTAKTREIDIRASYWTSDRNNGASISVELIIECKRSIGKPWVAFRAPTVSGWLDTLYPNFNDRLSFLVRNEALVQEVHLPPFMRQPPELAHGIVRAMSDSKTGDPTAPYAAVQGALTAAIALGKHNEELLKYRGSAGAWDTAHVSLPTVVVDGSLYDYTLDSNDVPQLRAVPSIGVTAAHPENGSIASVVIVTKEAWPSYVEQLTKQAHEFESSMLPHVPSICTKIYGSREP